MCCINLLRYCLSKPFCPKKKEFKYILKNGVKNESGLKSDEKRHVKLVRNDDNMRRYNQFIYMLCPFVILLKR